MSCSKEVGDAKDLKHCCNCFFDIYLLDMDFLYVLIDLMDHFKTREKTEANYQFNLSVPKIAE